MITLCVAQVGKNKYSITTTDMKDKLEEKYFYERQHENMKVQMEYLAGQGAAIGAEAQIRAARHYETLRAQQAAAYAPRSGLFGSCFGIGGF